MIIGDILPTLDLNDNLNILDVGAFGRKGWNGSQSIVDKFYDTSTITAVSYENLIPKEYDKINHIKGDWFDTKLTETYDLIFFDLGWKGQLKMIETQLKDKIDNLLNEDGYLIFYMFRNSNYTGSQHIQRNLNQFWNCNQLNNSAIYKTINKLNPNYKIHSIHEEPNRGYITWIVLKKKTMKGFEWGWMHDENNRMRNLIEKEFFSGEVDIYQKYFRVEENETVLDLGSSIGPFPYTIQSKKPKHIYCVEASEIQFDTLLKNTEELNVTCINKAIYHEDGDTLMQQVYGEPDGLGDVPTFVTPRPVQGIKFTTLIEQYGIDKLDFIKTDCEGGEYDVFNSENIWWIKDNVKKVAGEFHLSNPELKEKFRAFRDTYLRLFPNHRIEAVCGTDIKWDLWNEHFIEYYNECIIYLEI